MDTFDVAGGAPTVTGMPMPPDPTCGDIHIIDHRDYPCALNSGISTMAIADLVDEFEIEGFGTAWIYHMYRHCQSPVAKVYCDNDIDIPEFLDDTSQP